MEMVTVPTAEAEYNRQQGKYMTVSVLYKMKHRLGKMSVECDVWRHRLVLVWFSVVMLNYCIVYNMRMTTLSDQ